MITQNLGYPRIGAKENSKKPASNIGQENPIHSIFYKSVTK